MSGPTDADVRQAVADMVAALDHDGADFIAHARARVAAAGGDRVAAFRDLFTHYAIRLNNPGSIRGLACWLMLREVGL